MRLRFVFAIMAFVSCVTVFAQTKKQTIAPFKMVMTNGKAYDYTQIKKNESTVLIYFSPTCDHCKNFTTELLKQQNKIHNKQLLYITYEPMSEVKWFDSEFHLSSQSNVKIGTEGYALLVQKYYNIQRFPFIALYNKEGKLVKTLSPDAKPTDLVNAIVSL